MPHDHTLVVLGMCLAVEKRVIIGGWGATFERTVLVTEDGAQDLARS